MTVTRARTLLTAPTPSITAAELDGALDALLDHHRLRLCQDHTRAWYVHDGDADNVHGPYPTELHARYAAVTPYVGGSHE